MKLVITATINGQREEIAVHPHQTLLEFLRDDLKLKGAVEGCSVGVCGSCTVLIDGKPVSSCLTLASNIEGKTVSTIEGLSQNGELDPVQQAFLKNQAFQCGFYAHPSEEQARDYLSGNLCRCGTYKEVLAAVKELGGR
jgi:aerobic-type carbon monoxide dehydrogenase small subunit (CoxS/CutS family)